MSDNDLEHVRETAFHKQRTTLHLVSVPSKELYAKRRHRELISQKIQFS